MLDACSGVDGTWGMKARWYDESLEDRGRIPCITDRRLVAIAALEKITSSVSPSRRAAVAAKTFSVLLQQFAF